MSHKLSISQHTTATRKIIRNTAIAIVILFGALCLMVQNPLWSNIFRLCAFIGLAGTIINYLQARGKVDNMELDQDNDHLIINYYEDNQKKREEFYELQTIDSICPHRPSPIFKIIPRNDCIRFEISFTDSSKILSLFRYQGRDLFVSRSDAEKVEQFITQNNIEMKTA